MVDHQSIAAELEREVTRLRERNAEHEERYEVLDAWNDHLRAKVERLTALLVALVNDCYGISQNWDSYKQARAALATDGKGE